MRGFFPDRYRDLSAHLSQIGSKEIGSTSEPTVSLDVAAERRRLVRRRGRARPIERNVETENANTYADDSRQACHKRACSNDDQTDRASESLDGIKVGLERMLREGDRQKSCELPQEGGHDDGHHGACQCHEWIDVAHIYLFSYLNLRLLKT